MPHPNLIRGLLYACIALCGACTASDDAAGLGFDAGHGGGDAGRTPDAGRPADHRDSAVAENDAGDDDGGALACTLGSVLRFGHVGGFVLTQTVAALSKSGTLVITRSGGLNTADTMCSPALPACGSRKVDVNEIAGDLEDADVKDAFASVDPPFYGQVRPDAGTFHVDRDDGKSFDVAGDCLDEGDTGVDCTPAPAGVAKLAHDLEAIEDAGLLSSTCASL
jgi:hypothetical protein